MLNRSDNECTLYSCDNIVSLAHVPRGCYHGRESSKTAPSTGRYELFLRARHFITVCTRQHQYYYSLTNDIHRQQRQHCWMIYGTVHKSACEGQLRRQPTEIGGQRGKTFVRGSGGRKSPSGVQERSPSRGSGGRNLPAAEAFSLNYMIILTCLIMKKCNVRRRQLSTSYTRDQLSVL